jgi:phage terminase large subunit-like protein
MKQKPLSPRSEDFPHIVTAVAYCELVISGTVPASRWTHYACERHLADLRRVESDPAFPFFFDSTQAERVCRFLEVLPHVKGRWARRDPLRPESHRLRLEPWQCFIVCALFGWLCKGTERTLPDGRLVALRRFKEADIWIARKNGKSTFVAGLGLWLAFKDDEPGAEVYCGASTQAQAWEVFGPARQMCIAEPRLPADLGIEVHAKSLMRQHGGALAKFEPVIGKPGDGSSPHAAIIDEYHEHATSEQFDTFKTGMAAREQPLLLVISTAGFNSSGPSRDRWREGERILDGTVTDDRRFVLIFTVDDPEGEWLTVDGLQKANPNWGVSVNPSTVLADLESAKREARHQGAFKTKHCNVWVTTSAAFFNMEHWKNCESPAPTAPTDFTGQTCYVAADLASKVDLLAVAQVFPRADGVFAVFARYYAPQATVRLPQNQHLAKWAAEGWLTVTDGTVNDFSRVRDDLLMDCRTFSVAEIAFDPWQASMLINELQSENAPVVEMRQIVQLMSEPMKQLDALMRSGKLIHDGNPITAWCLANVTAQVDRKDNVYPRKERDSEKIDGAVALIMALGRAMLLGTVMIKKQSIYESRGLRII